MLTKQLSKDIEPLHSEAKIQYHNIKLLPDDGVVIIGSSAIDFAPAISAAFVSGAAIVEAKRFQDGETNIKIPQNVRDKDVYLVHRLSPPVNESVMELALTLDALTKASARRITVVLPYMGYARSDRRMDGREPIAAQLVARLIEMSGADRVVTLDVHSEQIQGFFRIPVDNIYGTNVLMPVIEEHLVAKGLERSEVVVVSPDAGGTKRARAVAKNLGASFAFIDKNRPRPNEIEKMMLLGDVTGKTCIIVDDMVDTAGTLCKAADLLKESGARYVITGCTHPILSSDAQQKIQASAIDICFVTDSIPIEEKITDKIEVIPLADFLSEVVSRESMGQSLLDLRHHVAVHVQ